MKFLLNQTWKKITLSVLVVGALMSTIWWATVGGDASNELSLAIVPTDHVRGSVDAPLVLIEYSDFQCPACATYYPIMKQFEKDYGDRLALVYRHFPLRSIHANAELVAKAAEAAGQQGKFFEMHDELFTEQKTWSDSADPQSLFIFYASELELDLERFTNDLTSTAVAQKVTADEASGKAARINATPTFFLNGKKISNPHSYQDFKALIESST